MKLSQTKGICSVFCVDGSDLRKRIRESDSDIDLDVPTPYAEPKPPQPVFNEKDIKGFRGGIPLP